MSEDLPSNQNWLKFSFWAAISFVATCVFTYAPNFGGEVFAISTFCIMVLSFFIGLGVLAGHRLAALVAALIVLYLLYLLVSASESGWIHLGGLHSSENLEFDRPIIAVPLQLRMPPWHRYNA